MSGIGIGEEQDVIGRAARYPWRQAQGFPYEPLGESLPRTRRRRGSSAASRSTVDAVSSVDRSSTTRSSNG